MKIYISGAITTNPENWKIHFADAEERLHWKYPNAEIINPLLMEDDPEYIEAQEYYSGDDLYNWVMRRDIRLITECSHIYLLNDWMKSNGARLECQVAAALGLDILYEEVKK